MSRSERALNDTPIFTAMQNYCTSTDETNFMSRKCDPLSFKTMVWTWQLQDTQQGPQIVDG